MSTNKQAYKKAIINGLSDKYRLCFRRYGYNSLTTEEYNKLVIYLKPLYTIIENDIVIFKYYSQRELLKLLKQ